MGQLITLLEENLPLPPIAALGFFEVLLLMLAMVWFASRYHKKHAVVSPRPQAQAAASQR